MKKPAGIKRTLGQRLRLRKTLFLLPNLITLSAIYCGFDSIVTSANATSENDFLRAAVLIVFAMFFDGLDGRVARMTKTQSAFGLQIDSLADIVSFGVAPAILMHEWVLHRFGLLGTVVSFLFVAGGAVRLARFNLLSMGEDGRPAKPSKYIVGLPTPPSAGILVSLVIADVAGGAHVPSLIAGDTANAVLAITGLLAFLMISRVQFRSFKDLRANRWGMLLVATAVGSSAIISTQLGPAFVLLWLLGTYVSVGMLETMIRFPGRVREAKRARQNRRDR